MDIHLLQNLTVLYVEDEHILRQEMSQNLAPFLKEIILATNGAEGLSLFKERQQQIDLIISDIMMPQMDGIAMVDAIRELDVDIPVIYATAFNDSEYLLKTIQQSVSSYILKPIDMELLLGAIEKASVHIENRKLKQKLETYNLELEHKVEEKTKELQKQNETLYNMSYRDLLTKLPNRHSLLKDLQSIENSTVIIIDLDAFKNINDLYGEDVGNDVLIQVATFLEEYISHYDAYKLYKIGPDEFVFMAASVDDSDTISMIDDLQYKIRNRKILINEYDLWINISVTIGVSIDQNSPLSTADIALNRAKEKQLLFYLYDARENIHKEYEDDLKYSRIIAKAVEEDLVVPYYQPIVDRVGKTIKYEALMRIVIDGEVYAPFFFLDISKKIKLYQLLEKKMIEKVFKKVLEEKIYVNINVSIEDVTNEEFIHFIEENLNQYNIGKYLTFEFLEDEKIFNYDDISKFRTLVKSYDAELAIDDFGSGYSSFAHVANLNVDYVKIDASLIKNIDKDKNSFIVVSTINDYVHSIGSKCVAEFVHSKEVFEILKEIGVDYFQGYYFSEPKA